MSSPELHNAPFLRDSKRALDIINAKTAWTPNKKNLISHFVYISELFVWDLHIFERVQMWSQWVLHCISKLKFNFQRFFFFFSTKASSLQREVEGRREGKTDTKFKFRSSWDATYNTAAKSKINTSLLNWDELCMLFSECYFIMPTQWWKRSKGTLIGSPACYQRGWESLFGEWRRDDSSTLLVHVYLSLDTCATSSLSLHGAASCSHPHMISEKECLFAQHSKV